MRPVLLLACAKLFCLSFLACGGNVPRWPLVDREGKRWQPFPNKLTVWLAVKPGACFGCLAPVLASLKSLHQERGGELALVVLVVGERHLAWESQVPQAAYLVNVSPQAFARVFGTFALPFLAVCNRKGLLVRAETLPPSGGTVCNLEHYFLE